MKTLLLLRHAKSSWDDPALDDHERALSPRGERAAALVGAWLAQREQPPSLVLCSSARRTLQTLEGIRPALGAGLRVQVERGLYLASPETLLARLAQVPDDEASVLLIGHNPGIEQLAQALVKDGDHEAIGRISRKFPTAAVAVVALRGQRWAEVARGGTLEAFVRPRDLV